MKRLVLAISGVTCIAAMLAVGVLASQPPFVRFDPAPGPVDHYEARVLTATEETRYLSPDATPEVELAMVPIAHEFWIDVRAVEADGDTGPWSEPHYTNPDCDENGGVGISDFVKCVRGISEFATLVEHWGHKTIWDEGLGLRRCLEEPSDD